MIDQLLQLLTGKTASSPDAPKHDPAQVALAAVLIEAALADGHYAAEEQAQIGRILEARFDLDETEAAALRAEAQIVQSEATDLVRFTRVIKDTVPYEDRVGVIEAVWRVIYADGDRDYEESALVRRLAGLLYVPDREAGLARQRVIAEG
ncbi:MAG: TerB family tellurite resistance protein [Pseudomonadota bacterium]